MKQKKLELTWIGKDEEIKLEPRILIEDPSKSYGDKNTENMLIHGDNLLALKALESEFTGKIKCIYIDPPYNTGNAFEQYDDNLEHSIWLSLMKPRLSLLHSLLKDDGVIFITVDDKEGHYVKVVCDEIFGRKNFIQTICWKSRDSISNDLLISPNHNFIFIYAKNQIKLFANRKKFRLEKEYKGFSNPDNDPKGPWKLTPVDGPGGARKGNPFYEFLGVSGYWRYSLETMTDLHNKGEIIKRGRSLARKYYLSDAIKGGGKTISTWWDDCGTATEAKKEIIKLFPDNIFDTPKPERLIHRVLTLSTQPGDWVLDSFLGSGTTSAVAHKMGRKYIGIELFDHCHTHCAVRLKKVIDGDDGLELTKTLNWNGGGGFRYYELASSLLNKDKHDNWVISKVYRPEMLAAAMAKQEGFKYNPDPDIYWKQGQSTEKDFIFTTTNFITVEMMDKIHEEMKSDESLLICCKSYKEACDGLYPNISIKKIPNMLLGRCEFGKDDYSLNIVNLPSFEEVIEAEEELTKEEKKKKLPQETLFPEK